MVHFGERTLRHPKLLQPSVFPAGDPSSASVSFDCVDVKKVSFGSNSEVAALRRDVCFNLAARLCAEACDGLAGDLVFRLSASHVASAWDIQTFTAIAPKGADGKPVLSKAFSDVDLKLLSNAILEDCDATDGVKDKLVGDPKAYRFDPARLACAGEKTDTCLPSPQVAALRRYIGGPKNSQGRALYSDWPWDPAFASPGWRMEARHIDDFGPERPSKRV